MAGEGTGLRGGFARSPMAWAFGKPGSGLRPLPLGIPSKIALRVTVNGERAVGPFDLAGQHFFIHFQHQVQTAEPQFAGWRVEGITWGQDCAHFEYCPPAHQ